MDKIENLLFFIVKINNKVMEKSDISLSRRISNAIQYVNKYPQIIYPERKQRIINLLNLGCGKLSKEATHLSQSGHPMKLEDLQSEDDFIEYILCGYSKAEQDEIFKDMNINKGVIIDQPLTLSKPEDCKLEQFITILSHVTKFDYIDLPDSITTKEFEKMF